MKQKLILLVAVLLATAPVALAQVGPPPPGAPIDGGLVALVAAGAAYGAKKLRDAQKENAEQNNDTDLSD
jgi:hypothetical protein